MKRNIVGLGEILWDCLPTGKQLGGAPANFAFHASQFGFDAVAVSALGNDELGKETLEVLNGTGLHYLIPNVNYPTGTVQVTLDDAGIPSYEIKREVAWDYIPFTKEIEEVAKTAQAVCFGTLAQRSEVSRDTITRFLNAMPKDALKIFDINLRQQFYTKEIISDSLKACDIMKINDDELETIGHLFDCQELDIEEKCLLFINKHDLKMLILTCGTEGSHVFTKSEHSFLATPKVNVADTVGAGDSFTGTFTAAVLSGMPIAEAHKLAVDVSAFVCTQKGAMPTLPDTLTSSIKKK